LVARVERIPDVQSAGFIDDMFLSGQGHASIAIPGHPFDPDGVGELNDATVTPGLFAALRVPVRRGRSLTRDDALVKIRGLWPVGVNGASAAGRPAPPPEPVVVNEAFVRRFFPTEDPVGKTFCIDPTDRPYWYVVVGVVGDMQRQGLDHGAIPEYFGALVPQPSAKGDLLVRTRGNPLAAAAAIRRIVVAAYPGALVPAVSTLDRQLGESTAVRSLDAWLFSAFAGLALLLAGVGIYGVVHFTVAERTREIGIRIALGAAASDVVRMVVLQGMRMPLVGLAIGIIGALALTRSMTHLLFGTSPVDPLVFAAVSVTLAGAAAAACYVPARRAAAIHPVDALRHE
jgi:predicted permease